MIYAIYVSCRLVRLQIALRRQVRALRRQPFEVLIKTCCFEAERPADGSDFYFGDLQQRLVRRGVRTLLLSGNVRRGSWTAFGRAHLAAPPLARLPELALLSPLAPLRLMLAQVRAAIRLRRRVRETDDPLIKHITLLASHDCLAPDTTRAGLYCWVMKRAVQTWRPRAFVTLYEGHAWEACARWGVKAHDPSCQTVGYQHTAIFPESLSLTSPSKAPTDRLVPDTILALGQIPLDFMASGHADHHVRLVRFGSFRYRHANVDRPADRTRRVILVVPEGFASEVKVLFEFAVACAKRLPRYTFVLRCHPEVPMAVAVRLMPGALTSQPNIELSDRRLIEEDFARSSAVLYRGSSTVLYAVLHGLLPLYVHMPTLLDRDPLYRMPAWRRRCVSPDHLATQLAWHEQAPMERLEEEWARAVRYVTDYTGPVTDEQIDAWLTTVGLNGSAR
ncbi:MAG: hypothetical protein HYY59_07475 [Candidatus Omnitrophica bacterium]|nr:hypothetical protein [Candidatus Omnitrophota bacterium]